MPTDGVTLLRLLQLFDSQFPIGAFAHSGGLETYGQAGADLTALRELMINQIDSGWGRSDLTAAAVAWRLTGTENHGELVNLNAFVDACKVIPSIRDTSVRLGARTLQLMRRLHPDALSSVRIAPPHHAVVLGVIGRLLDLPCRDLLLGYAHSLSAGTLAAATRCMPVSPAQAQALATELQPRLATAVDRALVVADGRGVPYVDALLPCTPALDIRSHQQAFLHTRLFQS